MSQVEIGELKELIAKNPDIAATLTLSNKLILGGQNINLGDYTTFLVAGIDEISPEIVIKKAELLRFANEVIERVK